MPALKGEAAGGGEHEVRWSPVLGSEGRRGARSAEEHEGTGSRNSFKVSQEKLKVEEEIGMGQFGLS